MKDGACERRKTFDVRCLRVVEDATGVDKELGSCLPSIFQGDGPVTVRITPYSRGYLAVELYGLVKTEDPGKSLEISVDLIG